MFYPSDVQSGISTALQSGRSVVCFVTDDGEESQSWEHTWLRNQNLPQQLESKAVTLRIETGSQEAQQLSAFYPVEEAPALLIINQGRLVAHIRKGTDESDFALLVLKGLHPNLGQPSQILNGSLPQQAASNPPAPTARSEQASSPTPVATTNAGQSAHQTSSQSMASVDEGAMSTPVPPTNASNTTKSRQQDSYAQRQARANQEARQERERVRALIEADKRSRRAREEQRRFEAQEASAEARRASSVTAEVGEIGSQTKSRGATTAEAAVSIRLMDGTALRSKFERGATLYRDVRPWIDANRTDGTLPYTFKVVLTPRPSRALDDADEGKTLVDLGLAPSASLVLVPVRNLSEAYHSGGSRGFIASAPALLYGYVASLVMLLVGFIKRLLGRGDGSEAAGPSTPMSSETETQDAKTGQSRIRVKTLQDQQDGTRDDQQLYNGNTLNFEPQQKDNDDGQA
ncbi:MAG: hypothetical protein Q9159_003350 [Coniocarpon cinnabarinum]